VVSSAQYATRPFVVGVWSQGDAVIPFADFDGQRWRSSWPAAVDSAPNLRPLEQVPAAWWGASTFQPAWELVEPTGRRRSIQITGTDAAGLGSSCSTNVGLKTNVPANTYQYGTVLAANRAGAIEPIETLTPKAFDWESVAAVLPSVYRDHEAAAWKDVQESNRPDLMATLPKPTLDTLFTWMDESSQYFYFESSRAFARRRDQFEYEHTFITGWLWRRSSASPLQAVSVQATTRDTDGKGGRSFRPLAVVRSGHQLFWLGSLSSYAYTGLTVLDVRRTGVREVLLVDYPGC
jgi:hypothetical protein